MSEDWAGETADEKPLGLVVYTAGMISLLCLFQSLMLLL